MGCAICCVAVRMLWVICIWVSRSVGLAVLVPVCNYCFAFVHSILKSERHKNFPVLIILCVAGRWFRRTGLKNNYSRPKILTTQVSYCGVIREQFVH
jgi:hypothetical protein